MIWNQYVFAAILFSSASLAVSPALARSIFRGEKNTTIRFTPIDFDVPNGRIDENLGWRLGCYFKTPPFNLPMDGKSEIEIIFDVSVKWEATVKDASMVSRLYLATLELKYLDVFENKQFVPKMFIPQHFGPAYLFLESDDGRLYMYGGTLEERKQIVHGPILLPGGSKDVTLGLCEIAPTTTIQLHEIQIRIWPIQQ